MAQTEFVAFPKIPRWNREVTISEKIDGTNAAIRIEGDVVTAQSRKRLITPEDDNFGFARWVQENAPQLIVTLGDGLHFGEWWGLGIQRGYGLREKRFSLFNTSRWIAKDADQMEYQIGDVPGLYVVPTMYTGLLNSDILSCMIADLQYGGSMAAPGFRDPEGIVIYHTAANSLFKVTVKDDEKPKGSTE